MRDRGSRTRRRVGWAGLLVFSAAILAVFSVTRPGTTPPITLDGESAAEGVAELRTLPLGGDDQWLLIRGHDRANPVLLFLHGGPGMPAMYLAHDFQREMERDFTIVHWDRRGAGKSYEAGADSSRLTVGNVLDETVELTEWLRREFGQDRIYLLGHSWGSYLGMLVVHHRPEYYAAFIGTGQMAADRDRVYPVQRDGLIRLAEAAGDSATVDRLQAGGNPSEADLFRYGVELRGARSMWPIIRTGLRAAEYDLGDVVNVGRGAARLTRLMDHDVISGPLDQEILEVRIPVFFFLGRHDLNTPSTLAAAYLEALSAPLKEPVWFENSAHFPFWTEKAAFHRELLQVRRRTEAFWSQRRETSSP